MINLGSKYNIGVRFGLLTGVIYVILLFVRYHFAASNPILIGVFAILSYLVILTLFLFTGIARKRELGGSGEMKEIFQSIFVAILITELFYILFNMIYFKFVDPAFWDNFRVTSLSIMEKAGLTKEEIDEKMKGFKDVGQETKPMGLIKGYGTGVVVDSIFGLIFAALLRKKKTVLISEEPKK
jgi:hypothetical protein